MQVSGQVGVHTMQVSGQVTVQVTVQVTLQVVQLVS
jgi:hypothetical protein